MTQCLNCRKQARLGSVHCTPCGEAATEHEEKAARKQAILDDLAEAHTVSALKNIIRALIELVELS